MYLPSFYKYKIEKYAFNLKRAGPFVIPVAIWIGWSFYPQFYNMVYTDIIPPARGVERRVQDDLL